MPHPESVLRDLTYAGRMLRKNPAFAVAAILTLALGIGANTAIFSVVYAVLLKPLPYADPDRLCAVHIWTPQFLTRTPSMGVRARDFLEWRRSNTAFSAIAAFRGTALNITGSGDPERLGALRASANLLSVLGVEPERGRGFLAEEDAPERNTVVMLGHEMWVSRFAGRPGDSGSQYSTGWPGIPGGGDSAGGIRLSHRQAVPSAGAAAAAHRYLDSAGDHQRGGRGERATSITA